MEWLPVCVPKFLQHLSECVGNILETISGVQKNLVLGVTYLNESLDVLPSLSILLLSVVHHLDSYL